MAQSPTPTKWYMKGNWIKNCNCNPGCPCDFNSPPSHHFCEGMAAMEVTDGKYGDVSLTGVKWAINYHWPGPLHEGHGTIQPFIESNTSQEQRDALLTIMSGQAGGTLFEIFAAITETLLEPQFVPIEFDVDMGKRMARVKAADAFETESVPIKNPVTGEEHQIRVQMPNGFEYELAEIASARINRSTTGIKYDHPNGHSSIAQVNLSN
jgi:hypothetical protein